MSRIRALLLAASSSPARLVAAISSIAVEKARAVVVTTASVEHKEKNRSAIAAYNALVAAELRDVRYIDFDRDSPRMLESVDLVYLSGGNPHYLLKRIRESGADRVLSDLAERGVPLIGASAGALVLGPSTAMVDIFDPHLPDFGFADREGLAIVPFAVLPHSNRWRLMLQDAYAERFEAARLTIASDLVELPDGRGIVLVDGEIEVIPV